MGFSVDSELQVEVVNVPPAEDQLGSDGMSGLESVMEDYRRQNSEKAGKRRSSAKNGSGTGVSLKTRHQDG